MRSSISLRVVSALVALSAVTAVACGGDGSVPTVPRPVVDTISTLPQSFVPNLITIQIGSTVVFAFGGGIEHNVIFDRTIAGAPADIQNAKDVNFARTFATRGAFKFDCTVHPGMRGEIDVQ